MNIYCEKGHFIILLELVSFYHLMVENIVLHDTKSLLPMTSQWRHKNFILMYLLSISTQWLKHIRPAANVIKLFTAVSYNFLQ